jgi:ADP-heptose:LPS heptosyltransferase
VAWRDGRRHVAERQAELIRLFAPDARDASPLRCELPTTAPAAAQRAASLLADVGVSAREFVLVHMGSGAERRRWPAGEWRALLTRLAAEGHRVVFTGRGAAEAAAIRELVAVVPGAVDLADRLAWDELVHVVSAARLVLTVETAAAHVAAATDTPCVAIWSGITSPHHWRPLGESVDVVTNAVPCAPCFLSHGCEEMSCVRGLTADRVLAHAHRALATGESPAAVGAAAETTRYLSR